VAEPAKHRRAASADRTRPFKGSERSSPGRRATGFSDTLRIPSDVRTQAVRREVLDSGEATEATAFPGASARPSAEETPGQRKKPGGHRKAASNKVFPTIPAVAGVATLVAAGAGAFTLHSGVITTAGGETPAHNPMPGEIALSVNQVQQARAEAAARADRSRRDVKAASDAKAAAAREARIAVDKEREAWAEAQSKETQALERTAVGATDAQVLERHIEWVLPVQKFRLSAGFGRSGSMWSKLHTGQDFASPMGTPVRSVGEGKIIDASYDGPYGNRIQVQLKDGTVTWYCHLSAYERRSGYVEAGTVIGYVGSTGNSTGPHLHFEVHPSGGDAIDPLPWLRGRGLL
jgi:murein DD-endopeptidase MepM/ murein hydrolase activator NlpD